MQALAGPALEKRVHMVYLDHRGSGQSDRPKDPKYYSMPLLFIAGGRDFQTALAPQRAVAAKVRDDRVIVYRNAGRFMFADEPERFARDVAAFVARASR